MANQVTRLSNCAPDRNSGQQLSAVAAPYCMVRKDHAMTTASNRHDRSDQSKGGDGWLRSAHAALATHD
jgi:hypothetical protein